MSIKKWSDFDKNKKKSIKKETNNMDNSTGNITRGHKSSSSEYADDINQNIIKDGNIKKNASNRKYKTKKTHSVIKDKELYPKDIEDKGVVSLKEDVQIYGRLAKFPQGVKASKAFNWVYNLKDPKLSKKEIWYLMVEKQDNELQMIKYQQKQGVNLTQFIVELKDYYINKYKDNPKIVEKISKIRLAGDKDGNISSITNIPNIIIDDKKKMIHKIMEDLVVLLG